MSSKIMFNTIVNTLEEINNLVPEQRFGQILYNYLTSHYTSGDTFYAEDKDILNFLTNELENIKEQIQVRQMIELDEQIKELRNQKQELFAKMTEEEIKNYVKFKNKVM